MPPHATRLALALVPLLAVSAAPAGAQIMSNPGQWYIDTQMYSTRVFNGVLGNSMRAGAGKGGGKGNAGRAAQAPVDHTSFRERAASALPDALARRAGNTPERQREARRAFDSFLALYKQTAQKDGFPANDLAYAFQYFVVNNYHIVHDLVDVPYEKDPRAKRGTDGFDRIRIMNEKKLLQISMYQERAIYEQFRASLGANPEIQRMTDAQKQEAAEMMAISLGVNFTAYTRAIDAGDDAAAEQARRMARQGLEKLLGVPLDRIKVTNTGLQL